MHLEIHEGWLRLYATINYSGIYADLAVNLGVVHAQFDRYRQRFVFQQLTDTDVIALVFRFVSKIKSDSCGALVLNGG